MNYAALDLSAYKGMVPVEMFGHIRFPPIVELPYFLTLGPHSFYWFKLEAAETVTLGASKDFAPMKLAVAGGWESVLKGKTLVELERGLPIIFSVAGGSAARRERSARSGI